MPDVSEPGAVEPLDVGPVQDVAPGEPDGESIRPSERRPRDRRGRFVNSSFEPLPDLAGGLSVVPGGLGVLLTEAFPFAGVRWTPADAGLDGSPIGVCLAVELAGSADRRPSPPARQVS